MLKTIVHDDKQQFDDFRLTANQLAFMTNAWNAIEQADHENDNQFFVKLAASTDYRLVFGEMSIDQAIDRYEIMR